MSLKDVVGQDKIINILNKSVQQNNPFHAYIFEGPEGIGKNLVAFQFAKALLCINYNNDVCNQCSSCKKMISENHPDFHIIYPEGNSIKDAQVEAVQKIMSKKPFEGKRIITVIDHAEAMTPRAQNRLLKTLEDPSGNTVTILLTENMSMLLPTISSRCMILKFSPLSDEVMRAYLLKTYDMDVKEASVLAAFSKGRIGVAKRIYLSEDFYHRRQKSIDLAKRVLFFKEEDLFNLEMEFIKEKENIIDILDMIEYWYRDIMVIASSSFDKNVLMNIDYLEVLLQETNHIGYEKAIKIIGIIEETKRDLSMNLNFNLVIKNMLLKIQEV